MKKLLVCDFDDTVKTTSRYITYFNFEAIKRFRKSGNKLVFSSGRDYNSLKRELARYSCSYDALICNNGSVGFDNEANVIFKECFNKYEIEDLLYYLEYSAKNYMYGYDLFNVCGYCKNQNNIVEIAVMPKLFKKKSLMLKELKSFFPNLHISKFGPRVLIRKDCTKSDGVKQISEFLNIQKENIYTVGDWKNDYEMIKDYNGYNVILSHPSLYKVSKGTVVTVSQLVKKLENK